MLFATVLIGGCGATGADIAADTVDDVVNAFVERIDGLDHTDTSGRDLAAMLDELEKRTFPTAQGGAGTVAIDPLAWSGSTRTEEGAVVEAQISVFVSAYDSGAVFGKSYEAGNVDRCFRFVVSGADTGVEDIDCPTGPLPPPPTRIPEPELPVDAEQRLTQVLGSASASTLAADVGAEFNQTYLFTDSAVDDGQFIVTVGTVGGGQCLVAVRGRDGQVTFPYVPREWIQPGEVGCRTALVTDPPQ